MLLTYIILASFAVMSVSLIGIVTINKTFKGWTERNLPYLTTLALGVFFVVAYNLFKEVFHTNHELPTLLIAILAGVLTAVLIDALMPQAHHHHEPDDHGHSHSIAGARRIMLSDSIHNITDGFLIATTFLIDIRLGVLTTIGILVHEVAQEISEFFVLLSAGYGVKRSLQINFYTSGTIIIGAVSGYFVATSTEDFIGLLLAVAAGIIAYTILRDLIPHSWKNAQHSKNYGKHITAFLIGILIIGTISMVNADSHVHSSSEHTHHQEGELSTHEHSQHSHDESHPSDEDFETDTTHDESHNENH